MAVANHILWPLAKFVNAKWVPKQHQPVANKLVQVSFALHFSLFDTFSAWLTIQVCECPVGVQAALVCGQQAFKGQFCPSMQILLG